MIETRVAADDELEAYVAVDRNVSITVCAVLGALAA